MSDEVFHEDAAEVPVIPENPYQAEDRAWRRLLRELTRHFTHECGEGELCDTYDAVIEAMNECITAGNACGEYEDME